MESVFGLFGSWEFWTGIFTAPLFLYLIYLTIKTAAALTRGWRKFFLGLPVLQYPCMMLMVIGAHLINKRHCRFMRYDERWWFSPLVKGFEAPVGSRDQRFN